MAKTFDELVCRAMSKASRKRAAERTKVLLREMLLSDRTGSDDPRNACVPERTVTRTVVLRDAIALPPRTSDARLSEVGTAAADPRVRGLARHDPTGQRLRIDPPCLPA